jgi:hypothetical protein
MPFGNHRPCTIEELRDFRDYHRRYSHVADVVLALTRCGAAPTRATLKGANAIGRVKTFFGNIGRARCRNIHGSDRFLVMQAADVLGRPDYAEDEDVRTMVNAVGRYKALFKTAASAPRVTIVQSTNDCLIADGNKTAIAAFLHACESDASAFELPVYYLEAPDHKIDWIL